jgi:hypothetical protein
MEAIHPFSVDNKDQGSSCTTQENDEGKAQEPYPKRGCSSIYNYYSSKAQCEQWKCRHNCPMHASPRYLGAPSPLPLLPHEADRQYLEVKVLEFKRDNELLVRELDDLDDEHNDLLADMDSVIDENEDLVWQARQYESQNRMWMKEADEANAARYDALDQWEKCEEDFLSFRAAIFRAKEKLKYLHPAMAADLDHMILLDLPSQQRHQTHSSPKSKGIKPVKRASFRATTHNISDRGRKASPDYTIASSNNKPDSGDHAGNTRQHRKSVSSGGLLANFIARIKAEGELEILGSEADRLAMVQAAKRAETQAKLVKKQIWNAKNVNSGTITSPADTPLPASTNDIRGNETVRQLHSSSSQSSLSPTKSAGRNKIKPSGIAAAMMKVPSMGLYHDFCPDSCSATSRCDDSKRSPDTISPLKTKPVDPDDLMAMSVPQRSATATATATLLRNIFDAEANKSPGAKTQARAHTPPHPRGRLLAARLSLFGTGGSRTR